MKKKYVREKNESESKADLFIHKKPVTRRDFLASGLAGASSFAFTSGASALLSSSNVMGQAMCNGTNILNNIGYLHFDAAGGMNIAGGNVIVGFSPEEWQESFGQNVFSDYHRLGIPAENHPSKTGMINASYGLKFHSTSGILEGLEEVLSPRMEDGGNDLRDYVDGIFAASIFNDDTSMNPISTVYQAVKVTGRGDLVKIIGTDNTVSGANSIANSNFVNLSLKPTQLTNFAGSANLLNIGSTLSSGRLLASTTSGGGGRMKNFMNMLAAGGAGRLNELKRNPQFANEVSQFQQKQSSVSQIFDAYSPAALNPLSPGNPDAALIARVFGQTDIAQVTGNDQRLANILNLITLGVAGAGAVEFGGADYHDGTATRGQNFDRNIGRSIGYAIRMAAERCQPIFITLSTDGGTTGDLAGQVDPMLPSRVVWRSDSGERGGILMIAFNPKRKRVSSGPQGEHSNFMLNNATRQIGHYNIAGGVNPTSHSLANNVNSAWLIPILNLMSFTAQGTDDQQILSEVGDRCRDLFGTVPADYKKLIRFRPHKVA